MKKSEWKRPFTVKRYLHPPLAEKLVTMWPDLRIVCGDITDSRYGGEAAGLRILAGDAFEPPNYELAKYEVNKEGIPLHAISYDMGEYTLRMESFCSNARNPSIFMKVSVVNPKLWTVSGQLALMLRTDLEPVLAGSSADGYTEFDDAIGSWGFVSPTWKHEGELLTDDKYQLRLQDIQQLKMEWQGDKKGEPWHRRHILKFGFVLQPGDEASFTAVLVNGTAHAFNYEAEKAGMLTFWRNELARIRVYPAKSSANEATMYRTLVAQNLQMFCYPIGQDYVLPRQGGMQRAIWPTEAVEFLIALDRIGDFQRYTDTSYELFFNLLQLKEGQDAGRIHNFPGSEDWANITGAAVWGVARHMLTGGDSVYKKYRDSALLAFQWMERQRSLVVEGSIPGIFPPMQATDWGDTEYQAWCFTDAVNLIGYQWLADALAYFNDPLAAEVRAAYEDYMVCLEAILADEVANNRREGEILISNRAGHIMPDPPLGAYTGDGPAHLIRSGVIKPNSETADLVENYFRNRGLMRNGLTGLMNDGQLKQGASSDPWAGHTWYVSTPDYCWFEHWLRSGNRDKALETLKAQLKYGLTEEYYAMERYADNDPYFVPWMPNASANGRLIMMLCDFYGENEDG